MCVIQFKNVLFQKLNERRATLKKSTLPEQEREKWVKCFVTDLIASEESDDENDLIVVKPLPWRATRLTDFFKSLDVLTEEEKSSQALRQRKQRVLSSTESSRPKPVSSGVPRWACE